MEIQPIKPSSPTKPNNSNSHLSFTQVSYTLPTLVFSEIRHHAIDEIDKYYQKIQNLAAKIGQGMNAKDSQGIIDYINLLITLKESVLKLISWVTVITSILYCQLEKSNKSKDDINSYPDIVKCINKIGDIMNSLKLIVPQDPILEITLVPDQKQLSETKAMIAKISSKLEEIEQDNQEAEKDWGLAEQNAYERLLEGSSQNVPAQEFLEWLTELEEGKDV